jgi:hypothetical protein
MASLELLSAAAVARLVSANLHDQSIAGQTDFLPDACSHRRSLFVGTHFVPLPGKRLSQAVLSQNLNPVVFRGPAVEPAHVAPVCTSLQRSDTTWTTVHRVGQLECCSERKNVKV